MAHRRTDSWDSDVTISGDLDPLILKTGASVALDLTLDEDDRSFRSWKRKRSWINLGLLCSCILM